MPKKKKEIIIEDNQQLPTKEEVIATKSKYELTQLVEIRDAWCMFYVKKEEAGTYAAGYIEYTGKTDAIKSEDLIGACKLFHALIADYNPNRG
jgi:hypothetical protein